MKFKFRQPAERSIACEVSIDGVEVPVNGIDMQLRAGELPKIVLYLDLFPESEFSFENIDGIFVSSLEQFEELQEAIQPGLKAIFEEAREKQCRKS